MNDGRNNHVVNRAREGKRLTADSLSKIKDSAQKLMERGSQYAACAHHVTIAMIETIAALEAELAEAKTVIKILDATCERWNARNSKLEEALKWYIATSPYSKYGMSGLGEKARRALEPDK